MSQRIPGDSGQTRLASEKAGLNLLALRQYSGINRSPVIDLNAVTCRCDAIFGQVTIGRPRGETRGMITSYGFLHLSGAA